jgi:hypothetical protein
MNPRYGTWQQDKLTITDFVNPVIKPTPSPAPSGATLPGGDGTSGRHAAVADPAADPLALTGDWRPAVPWSPIGC